MVEPWLYYLLVFLAGLGVGQTIWNIRHEMHLRRVQHDLRDVIRQAIRQSWSQPH